MRGRLYNSPQKVKEAPCSAGGKREGGLRSARRCLGGGVPARLGGRGDEGGGKRRDHNGEEILHARRGPVGKKKRGSRCFLVEKADRRKKGVGESPGGFNLWKGGGRGVRRQQREGPRCSVRTRLVPPWWREGRFLIHQKKKKKGVSPTETRSGGSSGERGKSMST